MYRIGKTVLLAVALAAGASSVALTAYGENWPAWRGPQGTGVSEAATAPTKWSKSENVRWKIALPGEGNATPIVWGEKVIVPSVSAMNTRRGLYCYHRDDGRLLWKQEVEYTKSEPTHGTNPFCSASPVTDGERVIMWHGSAGLFAYDLDGKPLWQRDLGEFQHIWGNASSPVLFGDLAILSAGPGLSAFVLAVDKKTGKDVWRLDFPELKSEKVGDFHGSWSTPVLAQEDGEPVMFLTAPTKLYALDPRTGAVRWECGGLSRLQYTSPLYTPEVVIAMSGYHGPAMGVKRGGRGDVSETHRSWLTEKPNPQRVGSGVVVGDHVYILNEPGIFWCIDVKTGLVKWEKRIGKKGSWSSIVHACGRLYATNMDGDTLVIEPNPTELKLIGENSIGELTRASLALSDGRFYLRTYQHLYCFEEK